MQRTDFKTVDKAKLIRASLDVTLGVSRALAIEELTSRALADPTLLRAACVAISSDRRLGFHSGPPLGWLGADRIFLSEQLEPMVALLKAMDHWDPVEQQDLMTHWAGTRGVSALAAEFEQAYGWRQKQAPSAPGTHPG